MALFSPLCKYPKFPLRFHISFSIPKLIVSETLNSCILNSKKSKNSISTSSNRSKLALHRLHCCTDATLNSSDESPNIVFVKGLSQSTSEKNLKMAFSQYGEVSRVKIVRDKKTRQSLGFAYVWFTSKVSVQVAVQEMDGKFFDGRFIYAAIAEPGSCKPRVEAKRYKF